MRIYKYRFRLNLVKTKYVVDIKDQNLTYIVYATGFVVNLHHHIIKAPDQDFVWLLD